MQDPMVAKKKNFYAPGLLRANRVSEVTIVNSLSHLTSCFASTVGDFEIRDPMKPSLIL